EDGIRDFHVTGVQTCALPIYGNQGRLQKGSGIRVRQKYAQQMLEQHRNRRDGGIEQDHPPLAHQGGTSQRDKQHQGEVARASATGMGEQGDGRDIRDDMRGKMSIEAAPHPDQRLEYKAQRQVRNRYDKKKARVFAAEIESGAELFTE